MNESLAHSGARWPVVAAGLLLAGFSVFETMVINVNCESELARSDRPRGLLYTHESQQLIFPGDRGFDLVGEMQSRSIDWGKRWNPLGGN